MKRSAKAPYSTAVSYVRGIYTRVARDSGVDVSFVCRVANGKRKSKVVEKALKLEYTKILALLRNIVSV